MSRTVRVLPRAQADLDEAYRWAARHAPQTAARWLDRFYEALQSLRRNPERCGFAPEHKKLRRDVRQLLFGRKPNVFRAVFVIDADAVRVLRVRRASRRSFTRKELGDL
jgi:plasmid stabilization system protein ParE